MVYSHQVPRLCCLLLRLFFVRRAPRAGISHLEDLLTIKKRVVSKPEEIGWPAANQDHAIISK